MAIFGRGGVNLAKSGDGWGCWAAELDNDGRDGRQLNNVLFICRPFLLWRFLVEVWAAVELLPLVQLSPIFAMAILSRDGRQLNYLLFSCRPFLLWRFLVDETWPFEPSRRSTGTTKAAVDGHSSSPTAAFCHGDFRQR